MHAGPCAFAAAKRVPNTRTSVGVPMIKTKPDGTQEKIGGCALPGSNNGIEAITIVSADVKGSASSDDARENKDILERQ